MPLGHKILSLFLAVLTVFSPATFPQALADGPAAALQSQSTMQGTTTVEEAVLEQQNQTESSSENLPVDAGQRFLDNDGGISIGTEAESENEEFPEVINDTATPEEIAEQGREQKTRDYLGRIQGSVSFTHGTDNQGRKTVRANFTQSTLVSLDVTFDENDEIAVLRRNTGTSNQFDTITIQRDENGTYADIVPQFRNTYAASSLRLELDEGENLTEASAKNLLTFAAPVDFQVRYFLTGINSITANPPVPFTLTRRREDPDDIWHASIGGPEPYELKVIETTFGTGQTPSARIIQYTRQGFQGPSTRERYDVTIDFEGERVISMTRLRDGRTFKLPSFASPTTNSIASSLRTADQGFSIFNWKFRPTDQFKLSGGRFEFMRLTTENPEGPVEVHQLSITSQPPSLAYNYDVYSKSSPSASLTASGFLRRYQFDTSARLKIIIKNPTTGRSETVLNATTAAYPTVGLTQLADEILALHGGRIPADTTVHLAFDERSIPLNQADINQDGRINEQDLAERDFNQDGRFDAQDLVYYRVHYGTGTFVATLVNPAETRILAYTYTSADRTDIRFVDSLNFQNGRVSYAAAGEVIFDAVYSGAATPEMFPAVRAANAFFGAALQDENTSVQVTLSSGEFDVTLTTLLSNIEEYPNHVQTVRASGDGTISSHHIVISESANERRSYRFSADGALLVRDENGPAGRDLLRGAFPAAELTANLGIISILDRIMEHLDRSVPGHAVITLQPDKTGFRAGIEGSARVFSFDGEGRLLNTDFSFTDPATGRVFSYVSADNRLDIADGSGTRLASIAMPDYLPSSFDAFYRAAGQLVDFYGGSISSEIPLRMEFSADFPEPTGYYFYVGHERTEFDYLEFLNDAEGVVGLARFAHLVDTYETYRVDTYDRNLSLFDYGISQETPVIRVPLDGPVTHGTIQALRNGTQFFNNQIPSEGVEFSRGESGTYQLSVPSSIGEIYPDHPASTQILSLSATGKITQHTVSIAQGRFNDASSYSFSGGQLIVHNESTHRELVRISLPENALESQTYTVPLIQAVDQLAAFYRNSFPADRPLRVEYAGLSYEPAFYFYAGDEHTMLDYFEFVSVVDHEDENGEPVYALLLARVAHLVDTYETYRVDRFSPEQATLYLYDSPGRERAVLNASLVGPFNAGTIEVMRSAAAFYGNETGSSAEIFFDEIFQDGYFVTVGDSHARDYLTFDRDANLIYFSHEVDGQPVDSAGFYNDEVFLIKTVDGREMEAIHASYRGKFNADVVNALRLSSNYFGTGLPEGYTFELQIRDDGNLSLLGVNGSDTIRLYFDKASDGTLSLARVNIATASSNRGFRIINNRVRVIDGNNNQQQLAEFTLPAATVITPGLLAMLDQAAAIQGGSVTITELTSSRLSFTAGAIQGQLDFETIHELPVLQRGHKIDGSSLNSQVVTIFTGDHALLTATMPKSPVVAPITAKVISALEKIAPLHNGNVSLSAVTTTASTVTLLVASPTAYTITFSTGANGLTVNDLAIQGARFILPTDSPLNPDLLSALGKTALLKSGNVTISLIKAANSILELQIVSPTPYKITFNTSPAVTVRDISLQNATLFLPPDAPLSLNLFSALSKIASMQSGAVNISSVTATNSLYTLNISSPIAYAISFNISAAVNLAPATITVAGKVFTLPANTQLNAANLPSALSQIPVGSSTAISINTITVETNGIVIKFTAANKPYYATFSGVGTPVFQYKLEVSGKAIIVYGANGSQRLHATFPSSTSSTMLNDIRVLKSVGMAADFHQSQANTTYNITITSIPQVSNNQVTLKVRSVVNGVTRNYDMVFDTGGAQPSLLRVTRTTPYRRIEIGPGSTIRVFNSANAANPSQTRNNAPAPLTLAYLIAQGIL